MSQFLMRLEAKMREAKDLASLGELKIRKACYLARTGYADEAKRLIAELRKDFGDGRYARVSAWIMLAEGLIDYFGCPGPVARDRIARSELIAVATRDPELAPLACAWKAMVEFEFSNFDAMAASIRKALEFYDSNNHEANSRVAIILSDCFYLCGDRDSAQFWFMASREHALQEGDQATIDALLYNKAAFSTASLRVRRCFGDLDRRQLELVRMEVASAANFQRLAGIVSVNHLILLSEARILLLLQSYDSALAVLQRVREEGPFASHNFDRAIIDLEIAYCLARQGLGNQAQAAICSAGCLQVDAVDLDERLVYYWLRRELALMGFNLENGGGAQEDFQRTADEYKEYQARLHGLAKSLAEEFLRKRQVTR